MTQQAPGASDPVSWVLVNTHLHKERFAAESLNRLQFVGYCPMLLKRIRHARRTEVVSRPIVSGTRVRWRACGHPTVAGDPVDPRCMHDRPQRELTLFR